MSTERLAIIRDAHIAPNDHLHETGISFSAYVEENVAASHWVGPSDGEAFASLWEVMGGDVDNLNGKPCWVSADGTLGERQRFIRAWRP